LLRIATGDVGRGGGIRQRRGGIAGSVWRVRRVEIRSYGAAARESRGGHGCAKDMRAEGQVHDVW
jgi:hypothetical protein